ncbi:hypothetical protein BN873_1070018 [Candidatus Competibacter denitrificans Run_A_D11]|uniref:Uncharacterized protein n=1 Tax=Candidatus Competibacter denitrificans Run_A_D11 TaxID=1400863 RepID=W6M196_9GAMM|nr:hypothetical protein BN873_1070018 [Candidatus Competibacter denitrificans Run_A_D11]
MRSSRSVAKPELRGTPSAPGQWVSRAESSLTVLSESDQWLPAALSFSPVAGLLLQILMKSAGSSAQWTSLTSGGVFLESWNRRHST